MSVDTARLTWGVLAGFAGLVALAGLVLASRAIPIAHRRRLFYQYPTQTYIVATRDLLILCAVAISSAMGLVTSGILIWLLCQYGPELDAVLEHLAVPVMLAYAGYAATTTLTGLVIPVWLLARLRASPNWRAGEWKREG